MSAGRSTASASGPGDPALLTVRAVEVAAGGRAPSWRRRRARGGESLALSIARALPAGGVRGGHGALPDDRGPRTRPRRRAWDEAAATLLAPVSPLAAPPRSPSSPSATRCSTAPGATCWRPSPRLSRDGGRDRPRHHRHGRLRGRPRRPLAEGRDPLLVWPDAPPADAAALLELAPNIVFMKADRHLEALADLAGGEAVARAGPQPAAVRRACAPAGRPRYFTTDLRSGRCGATRSTSPPSSCIGRRSHDLVRRRRPGRPRAHHRQRPPPAEEADVVVYAGSLVPEAVLTWTRDDCACHDSAPLALEEQVEADGRGARGRQGGRAPAHRRPEPLRRDRRADARPRRARHRVRGGARRELVRRRRGGAAHRAHRCRASRRR